MSKKVFSFCVYGSNPKYCLGMVKNIEQIIGIFYDFEIWIHCGSDVPQVYKDKYNSFPTVKVIDYTITGGRLTLYRLFSIDDSDVDIMIVRDADSRFENRDIWCINNFMGSPYKIYTIRDHPWHGRVIMAGLCGFKKLPDLSIKTWYTEYELSGVDLDEYQADQTFLEKYVFFRYKNIQDTFVAYTPHPFYDEKTIHIEEPRRTPFDFCGNVVLFNEDGREYYEFSL